MSKYEVKSNNDNGDNKALTIAKSRGSVLSEYNHWIKYPAINFEKHREVEKRCIEYFKYIEAQNGIPSYEGLSLALGINSKKLHQLEVYNIATPETSNIIARYKAVIEAMDYELALTGVLTPSVYNLRANYFSGIVARSQIDLSPVEADKKQTPEELLEQLKNNQDLISDNLD